MFVAIVLELARGSIDHMGDGAIGLPGRGRVLCISGIGDKKVVIPLPSL
jgi:hypothetical protein